MQREQIATAGIVALTGALVGAALLVVGGPEQARIERRDEARMRAVGELAECLRQMSEEDLKALPADLTPDLPCGASTEVKDPFTETPLHFERVGETAIKVCAEFEAPDRVRSWSYQSTFDPKTGCLTAELVR